MTQKEIAGLVAERDRLREKVERQRRDLDNRHRRDDELKSGEYVRRLKEELRRNREALTERNREMDLLRSRIADLENATMSEQGIEAMGYMKLPVGEEGEPIRPGETVYGPNTGDDGKNVLAATPLAVLLGGTDQWSLCLDPGSLTHEQPQRFPLDADGVECRVGDRVWWSENPTVPLVIEAVEPDEYAQLTVCDDDGLRNTIEAAECTHTEPDSWERLEDDATMEPFAYLERHGLLGIDIPTAENFACDLVRRAKALAGIGGGE